MDISNRIVTLAAVSSLLFLSTLHAEEQKDVAPETLEELQAAIAEVVAENDVPAVGIALVDESAPVWVDSIGKANLENDIDADEYSLFRIGSTSKMFVSLSVLKLAEEGKLSLDDKLSDLAPDVAFENQWEDTDPVRLVHLLEHTTGWDDIHLPDYAHSVYPPVSLKEALDFHPHSRTSRWKPGTRSSYCNSGPGVAAYIVEKVTGKDYEQYVEDTFFTPMGMETMTHQWSDDVREKGVTPYTDGNQPRSYEHISMRPSGGINASPRDMARFLQFYINRGAVDGEQLIPQESLARMESVESTSAARAGQEAGYGLSNYSTSHKNWVFRAHNGGVTGGITDFAYLPEARIGYAMMMNSDDGRSFLKVRSLLRDFATRNLEPPEVTAPAIITSKHRAIEGLYHPINSRQQLSYFLERVFAIQKLWFDGEKLLRRPLLGGKAFGYFPVSSDLYADEKTGMISLSRTSDPLAGDVVHVSSQVLKPVSALLVFVQFAIVFFWAAAIGSSVIYFLIWGVRKLRGKIDSGATISIRLWPLLASLSVVVFLGAFMIGMIDPFTRLSSPTLIAITVMIATGAFALFAALGVHASITARHVPMNRVNYWHLTVASATHLIVAIYLYWFGIIGLMTWA
jgi:CubicO group peptidase (beta-lactamase class C family)